MNLSEHFTLAEGTFSSTALRLGLDNMPSVVVLENMKATAGKMETVRKLLGEPLHVDSWFRSEELNAAVGGSEHSAHMSGWAVDFVCPAFGPPEQIVRLIDKAKLQFDQCIQEGTWVHISFAPTMRQEVLTAHFNSGKTTYTKGA